MSYFEVLNEVQEITLRHERLINKLRIELSRVSSGSHSEDLIKDIIEDLRHVRKIYHNLTSKVTNIDLANDDVDDKLYTLIEYNTFIALNNELELLKTLSRYIRHGRIKTIELNDIINDISCVNKILVILTDLLPTIKNEGS